MKNMLNKTGSEPLAIFRITLCLVLLIQWFQNLSGLEYFYDKDALKALSIDSSPFWFELKQKIESIIGEIKYQQIVYIHNLYGATILLLLFGVMSRLSAIVALLMLLVLKNESYVTAYGAYELATIGLFYCVILPVSDSFSFFQKQTTASNYYTISQWALRGQMSIIYVFAAYEKSQGQDWLNGESIWRTFARPQAWGENFHVLYESVYLLSIAGILVIAIQAIYPILLINRKTRMLNLFLVEFMHISIAISLGLWVFSGIMLAINLGALLEAKDINRISKLTIRKYKKNEELYNL